jgi:hypothetical protein
MIGLKELVLLALVVLALYGRSGVVKSRQFQTIWPWIAPVRRSPRRPAGLRAAAAAQAADASSTPARGSSRRLRLEENRVFWFLTIVAATGVAAWIVTRLLILRGAGPGLTH